MWWWLLIWTLLVIGGLVVIALVIWRLIRQVIALGREIGRQADRLRVELDRVPDPYRPARSVLSDPSQLDAGRARRRRPAHRHR